MAAAGLTPQEQIARRDQASRADAKAVAAKRANAASRALASLSAELLNDQKREAEQTDPLGSLAMASPAPEVAKTTTKPATPSQSPTSAARPATVATPAKASATTKPSTDKQSTPSGKRATAASMIEEPLLELRPSALSSDLSRAGERLAIFNDRVEMRDRLGRSRESVEGSAITDVVIQKRFTGVVLVIEDVSGPVITIKGLTTQQAEQARTLIMRKTRPVGSVPEGSQRTTLSRHTEPARDEPSRHEQSRGPVDPDSTTKRTWQLEIDEGDLLRKLGDLHRAGILNDDEFRDKVDVIHRMVHGETLTVTNG